MDTAQEKGKTVRQKDKTDVAGTVADGIYGMPTFCCCGARMIDEVLGEKEFDTNRFFTCKYFKDNGKHFRQPWVLGVQEEIQKVNYRLDEAESLIWGVRKYNKEIAELKEQIEILSGQVACLEKLCYE